MSSGAAMKRMRHSQLSFVQYLHDPAASCNEDIVPSCAGVQESTLINSMLGFSSEMKMGSRNEVGAKIFPGFGSTFNLFPTP